MSEGDSGKPTFDKGDRAAIVAGRKSVGVRGSVFWVGENKYGPGMRYGLRGDDGETYWIDDEQIGREEDAPPAPKPEPRPAPTGPSFEKGDRVRIISGASGVGLICEVFWTGASKYGDGMRYGVRGPDEETYWVDGNQVEADPSAPATSTPKATSSPRGTSSPGGTAQASAAPVARASDDAPPPAGDDELPPEAFEDDDLPPEAYEDDIPF